MKKYRLRWDDRIVGYAQETKQGILFKGNEWLWFLRGKPRYNTIDECLGIKDKMLRDIYELDIITYKISKEFGVRVGVILWEKKQQQFVCYDIESKHFTPIFMGEVCLFDLEKPEIISHLFNQKELQETLHLYLD